MALYLGEAVRIRATATDPDTGSLLDPPPTSAHVDFWAPGVDRKTNAPTISGQAMSYRSAENDFVLYQDTQGTPWVAGKWVYRVTVVGDSFSNFEYDSFRLSI